MGESTVDTVKNESPLVKELRDQAARETVNDDDPFAARKLRVEWKAAERIEAIEALLQEGVDGFSRVLVGTSDHERVYGWVGRCAATLKAETTE